MHGVGEPHPHSPTLGRKIRNPKSEARNKLKIQNPPRAEPFGAEANIQNGNFWERKKAFAGRPMMSREYRGCV